MEFRVAGNELHLRGKVEGYESGLFKDVVAEHPEIDTVVFRDSPGGDGWSAFRVAERIRDGGFRTVLAGRCHSACTIMFLGGRERHFARAARAEFMYLAFHGAWTTSFFEANTPSQSGRYQVRAWILERTGGKVDADLLDRFLTASRRAALLYAFDPRQFTLDTGLSMYFCEGDEPRGARPHEACVKLAGHDAFSMGFMNSEERIRVKPVGALPPPFKRKSLPSGTSASGPASDPPDR